MFDNLFSIESVFSFTIAITVSIAITIKVFKLNLTIKNKSHVVNGDGNNIEHNEFNFIMKETQCDFRSLSFFLGGTLLLLLPYCGLFINSALYSFSLMAPYFCVLGVFFILWTRGFINRFPDCFYIISTLFNVYFASRAAENSYYFMRHFDGLYDRMLSTFTSVFWALSDPVKFSNSFFYFLEQVAIFSSVLGFIIVFIMLLYSTFGYLKQRSFTGALTFVLKNCIWCFIGYLAASGIIWGVFYKQNQYVESVLEPAIQLLSHFFNPKTLLH